MLNIFQRKKSQGDRGSQGKSGHYHQYADAEAHYLVIVEIQNSNEGIIPSCWKTKSLESADEQCKLRWKNIRNSFIRHLRDTPPSGSGSSARKKPDYLHEYLPFLVPFTKSRKQSSNLNTSNLSDSTEIADDDLVEEQEMNDTINEIQEAQDRNALHPDPADEVSAVEKDSEVVKDLPDVGDLLVQKNSERKKKCTIEDVAASYFASRANEINDNDGMLHFLKSLLPDIKNFSDRRKRQCKAEILKIVNDLAENEDE